MSELIGNAKTTDPGQPKGDMELENIPSLPSKKSGGREILPGKL